MKYFSWAAALLLSLLAITAAGQTRRTFEQARNRLVDEDIVGAGIKNARVIDAMRRTPRHEFVPLGLRNQAYLDQALPIGGKQTISPPFIVAYMTEVLDPQPNDRVLEIGTGSGYQAAVLSHLVKEVFTIEIVEPLGRKAEKTLEKLHYKNVHVKIGDGFQGWPEHAPFDKIIVTCSPENAPAALVDQLKEGGRMVIPVGERYQQTMYLMKKVKGKLEREALKPTLFVPMTGTAEGERKVQPDPENPQIENGGFEEVTGKTAEPLAWHYRRLAERVESPDAPEGNHTLVFRNTEPDQNGWILQGFAVDGRKVKTLDVALKIRGENLRPSPGPNHYAGLAILFYDENRATIALRAVGPWRGTFPWRTETTRLPVPLQAREAILRIGLFGVTGELAVDDVKISAVKKEK
ncbi:MAG: protein-L-isoaspartate(D-aspartate) O-methyltransferase [Pirellulales bacterium]|nr:protein-L-isoaspartate(D-aspartate) O-methyltransferase [Pirellulales bacterium]